MLRLPLPRSPDGLRERGAHVHDVPLYDTVKVANENRDEIEADLLNGKINLVTFTSSSTVTNFLEMFPAQTPAVLLTDVQVAAIGPETQKTAIEHGVQVNTVAKQATIESLVEAIIKIFV